MSPILVGKVMLQSSTATTWPRFCVLRPFLMLALGFWSHHQHKREQGQGARDTFGSRLPKAALASFFSFYSKEQFSFSGPPSLGLMIPMAFLGSFIRMHSLHKGLKIIREIHVA